jgi:hypothetical protein
LNRPRPATRSTHHRRGPSRPTSPSPPQASPSILGERLQRLLPPARPAGRAHGCRARYDTSPDGYRGQRHVSCCPRPPPPAPQRIPCITVHGPSGPVSYLLPDPIRISFRTLQQARYLRIVVHILLQDAATATQSSSGRATHGWVVVSSPGGGAAGNGSRDLVQGGPLSCCDVKRGAELRAGRQGVSEGGEGGRPTAPIRLQELRARSVGVEGLRMGAGGVQVGSSHCNADTPTPARRPRRGRAVWPVESGEGQGRTCPDRQRARWKPCHRPAGPGPGSFCGWSEVTDKTLTTGCFRDIPRS